MHQLWKCGCELQESNMPRIGRERVICLPHELSVFSTLLFNGKEAILGAYGSFSHPPYFPLVVLIAYILHNCFETSVYSLVTSVRAHDTVSQ